MTNAIAGSEFRSLLNPQTSSNNSFETSYAFPDWLGQGYKRDIELQNQITLTLHEYQLQENLLINCSEEKSDCLEVVFNLSSTRQIEETYTLTSGQHYLMGKHTQGGRFLEIAEDPIKAVDIHICPSLIESLLLEKRGEIWLEFSQILEEKDQFQMTLPQQITPQMKVALEQIFSCPFQGMTKQLYLEAKALELVALQIEMITQTQAFHPISSSCSCFLKGEDIDRIYAAKDILIRHWDNPPSLSELAQQVELNTRKLKTGFRQVFQTTAFGYLHQYRMEMAQQMLRENQPVGWVANAVGYASPTSFTAAFRRCFGMTPKAYQLSRSN
jgi:AraC-like DNA-binding protein